MIIQNAMLEFKCKTTYERDKSTGHVLPAEEAWTDPVPCQAVQTAQNLQARANGEPITTISYTVYLNVWEHTEPLMPGEQVRLLDMEKREIGQFPVISTFRLDAVDEIRITL